VSSRRLPVLLALCVALFAGFVPLRECLAAGTGEQAVVALGSHAHGHEHDGHEHDGHEHDGHEHDGHAACDGLDAGADRGVHRHGSGHDESGCCVDAPFATGVRLDVVTIDRAVDASSDATACAVVFLSLAGESLDASLAQRARPRAPPIVRALLPSGVRSVVLLR